MAPEMQLNQLDFASQENLTRADMWSLGFAMHAMMNPELRSPYRAELEQYGVSDPHDALNHLLKQRRLPEHGTKYEQLQVVANFCRKDAPYFLQELSE